MTTIVGVDFSGHRDDRNTWVALGRLDTGGALRLDGVQPARRADLFELLAAVPAPAVAALDFPFGGRRHGRGVLGARPRSLPSSAAGRACAGAAGRLDPCSDRRDFAIG